MRADVCLGKPSRTQLQCVLQPTCMQTPRNMSLAMPGVRHKGERLRSGLREAFGGNPHVKEVRGQGLICGIQLDTVSLALHALATLFYFCMSAVTMLMASALPLNKTLAMHS